MTIERELECGHSMTLRNANEHSAIPSRFEWCDEDTCRDWRRVVGGKVLP